VRTQVGNGQTVEVITAKGAHPNPSWVNFVATAKARASIRQYLKNLRFNEALELGKRLLDQALRDAGTPLRKISDQQMKSLLDEFGLNNTNELFEQLGLGERLAPLVAKALLQSAVTASAQPGKPTPNAIAGPGGPRRSRASPCRPGSMGISTAYAFGAAGFIRTTASLISVMNSAS